MIQKKNFLNFFCSPNFFCLKFFLVSKIFCQKNFSLQNFSYKFFFQNQKTTKKLLKMEKKHYREIDRRERLPTVNRKLARPGRVAGGAVQKNFCRSAGSLGAVDENLSTLSPVKLFLLTCGP